MRRTRERLDDDSFNFWPSFADLSIAFTLFWVLIVILAMVTPAFEEGVIRREILRQVEIAMQKNSPIEYQDLWELEDETGTIKLKDTDVLFASANATLSDKGTAVVNALAKSLSGAFKDHGDVIESIMIEGFADCNPIGAAIADKYPTNWELSSARASSVVRQILLKIGDTQAIANKFCAVGYGSARATNQQIPLASDRRIEIRILTRSSG